MSIYHNYPVNVLILTPDAVGSTLLQRLITIYMQFHDFDRPVINLHELTNGLEKYYSPEFNREIVSKSRVKDWGYYQSLEEVVRLLSSVDHYKTSRLAQYHIRNRQDPLEQQIPFYQYLDSNFFVIACRRHNVFEHALSMSLNTITKRLNVYSPEEKINTFIALYTDKVEIDQRVLVKQLGAYQQYLDWSSNHFNIGSYFYYDQHLDTIEKYILNLPVFSNQPRQITWQEKFDVEFNDWNRLHHVTSDLSRLSLDSMRSLRDAAAVSPQIDRLSIYQKHALPDWPAAHTESDLDHLPSDLQRRFLEIVSHENSASIGNKISDAVVKTLDQSDRAFMLKKGKAYNDACAAITQMQHLDIIVSPPPIKKQMLQEKMHMIKNFDQCLETYNEWATKHPDVSAPLSGNVMKKQIAQEQEFWRSFEPPGAAVSDQPPIERLGYQNDGDL